METQAPRMGMVKVQIWGFRCERCGHEWVPRNTSGDAEPRVCPRCKSPYWDRPRQAKKTSKTKKAARRKRP